MMDGGAVSTLRLVAVCSACSDCTTSGEAVMRPPAADRKFGSDCSDE